MLVSVFDVVGVLDGVGVFVEEGERVTSGVGVFVEEGVRVLVGETFTKIKLEE